MLIRPDADDIRLIGYQVGRIMHVVAILSVLPLAWTILDREWAPAAAFLLMIGVFTAIGSLAASAPPQRERIEWGNGMVVVAITWLVVPVVGSIPLVLSGHYAGVIDAIFDAMSGLTTTGLALVQDLDHLAPSLNFWRHLLHFMGGQGIIIAALSLFAGAGITTLYYGEARDDRIFPSVRSTARFIWAVSLFHAVVGVTALAGVAYFALGFRLDRALFHGLMIFFAAFDTGGFAPQSTSLGYYHSAAFEAVAAVLMVAGAMSFGVHYALWRGGRRELGRNIRGGRRELGRNIEVRAILTTFLITMALTFVGLAVTGAYASFTGLSRQGFFQILSAHTGTGFTTIPPAELATWSGLAFGGMVLAMGLGGMASSTAGGLKAFRVGLTTRSLGVQIKQVLLPEHAIVPATYQLHGKKRLTQELMQAVMVVSLLYVALYIFGAIVGMGYGLGLESALFESVSAGANVGLSVGVTSPTMPGLLKVVYLLQMWAGRLEFVAVISLLGFLFAWVRGK
jgi:trk system potassium uptake protein TrkH